MLTDRATINVCGGRGGNGCASFRREKHVPRGGPDGGDGGRGGDVVIVATRQVRDLTYFRHHVHFKGGNGGHGSGQRRHGRAGDAGHDLGARRHRGPRPRRHAARRPRPRGPIGRRGARAAKAAAATPASSRRLDGRRKFAERGLERRRTLDRPHAQAHRRRRPRRAAQCRQVVLARRPHAGPSRRSPPTRSRPSNPISARSIVDGTPSCWPTSPASSKARARAPGSATAFSHTSSAPGRSSSSSTSRTVPRRSSRRCPRCAPNCAPLGRRWARGRPGGPQQDRSRSTRPWSRRLLEGGLTGAASPARRPDDLGRRRRGARAPRARHCASCSGRADAEVADRAEERIGTGGAAPGGDRVGDYSHRA